MPRRIPTQVDQTLSRLLKGGYLKQAPVSYQTMLSYPPAALPPREPVQRPTMDSLSSTSHTPLSSESTPSPSRRNPMNSKKRSHMLMPKLSPQPIVYLADRVRQRFFQDHPWESFRPRTLVEGDSVQEMRIPHPEAVSLTAWGRNPSPEDVVACTVHLHKNHSLPLSQAYHHTLSSYHALRAEHEHASRSAILEARAYGAVFALSADGSETAAVEIERGYRKEGEELEKGAAYFRSVYGMAEGDGTRSDASQGTLRVKTASGQFSRGQLYLKAALEARDGVQHEMEPQEPAPTLAAPELAAEEQERVEPEGQLDPAMAGRPGQSQM